MKVYGLICDNGDGSSSIHWLTDKSLVDDLLENSESYYANEGSPAVTLDIPDGLCLKKIGIFL